MNFKPIFLSLFLSLSRSRATVFYFPLHAFMYCLSRSPTWFRAFRESRHRKKKSAATGRADRMPPRSTNLATQLGSQAFRGFLTVLRASLRSSAFLGSFIGLVWGGVCLTRQTLQDDTVFGPLFGSFLSGWSIFIERKHRRAELACYVLPRALQSFASRVSHRFPSPVWTARQGESFLSTSVLGIALLKLYRSLRMDVLCFSVSCALMMWLYTHDRRRPRGGPPPMVKSDPGVAVEGKSDHDDDQTPLPVERKISSSSGGLVRAKHDDHTRRLLRPTLQRLLQFLFEG